MISDIFVITGFGLIAPILAIFIKENITGGTIIAAGLASTLFILVKSCVQLPFSRYVDNHDRKVRGLILGTFIISFVPFIYMFATKISHIYTAQIIQGIGAGLMYPTWLGLWSTHLDKKHESFEWSLYSTCTGLGVATTAAVGAAIASKFGYQYSFALTGFLALLGALVLFGLERKKERESKIKSIHFHRKSKLFQRIH